MRRLVDAMLVEAKGTVRDRHEVCRRLRVAAREQRDVVSLPDELVGQVRDDSFGPPVVLRRDALEQRCNLRDPHVFTIYPDGRRRRPDGGRVSTKETARRGPG